MDLVPMDSAEVYGGWVASVLEHVQKPVADLSEQFIAGFYELLSSAEHNRKLLQRLTSAEYAQLQKRQSQHLMLLISPGLTHALHMQEAERAGRAHALVGVDIQWLIETYGLYQEKLFELLEGLVPHVQERERLIRILSRRILLDIEGQVRSFERIDRDMSEAFLQVDRKVLAAANPADLVREAMAAIGGLEGEVCLFLARADAHGILQIEASFGSAAERYHRAMEAGIIPKISTDGRHPSGRGLAGARGGAARSRFPTPGCRMSERPHGLCWEGNLAFGRARRSRCWMKPGTRLRCSACTASGPVSSRFCACKISSSTYSGCWAMQCSD
jgi:hypothetical protein